jgi:outer membrane protein assembly factor BamB
MAASIWILANAAAQPVEHGEATPRATQSATENWPQWRGPSATGVAPNANPPVNWSETENIRWKIPLPGSGHSTPIVWGDRVFVTTAIPVGDALEPRHSDSPGAHDNAPVTHEQEFAVLAIRRSDGEILWQRTVHKELPHEQGHVSAGLASNSPVTDGEHVFVSFGSRGLYCLDFAGEPVWQKDLGRMQTKHGHGEGSSPALYGDTLIVNWDHEGESFIAAFDKRTGDECWKIPRNEPTSWATPIVVEHEGRAQVVVSGTNRLRGYDLEDGRVLWECGGLSQNVVASPVSADGMVFAGSSYNTRAMLAVRLDGAHGDITGTDRVAWNRIRGVPYVPSPLLYGDSLYFLNHYQPILSRVNAATGEDAPGALRLDELGNIYASPVGAANRVYVTDREGTTIVITHAAEPQVLAVNRLDDHIGASAAVAGNELYLRGRNLYCIAEK